MSNPSRPSSVVVIGGGIFGVSTAVHLARKGMATTIINDGPVANGASSRSLAWLNSARKRSEAYHRLRLLGLDRYRMLAIKNPGVEWLKFGGGLTWDADDASNEIEDVFAYERERGYSAHLLQAADVAAVTPGIDPKSITSQGAIFNPGEGWVDLPSLCGHLIEEFRALGGTVVTDAGRAEVILENGRAVGAAAADGRKFMSDAVLVATGAGVPAMAAKAGRTIGDDTPIALLVFTKPIDHPLEAVLNTPRVAVRPTVNGAFALDSAWSEEEVVRGEDGTYSARQSTIDGLLREASAVLEGNPVLEFDSVHLGPKPIPGDGEPVFGALEGIPGYHVAFSHSGATLGLIAGELLADEIETGKASPLLDDFRPGRFSA